MQKDYASFLDYRATQRQLVAKFARPWLLLLHVVAFLIVMTGTWVYGGAWGLWFYRDNFIAPVLVGLVWSVVLAGHALWHYRRSAAQTAQREQAVENEMRAFIARHRDAVDSGVLFEMHRTLEGRLAGQGRWSLSLTAFALVNAVSWGTGAANMGSSWPFQMTPIFAAVVIGGVQAYLYWQQQRDAGRKTWVTRVPLLHIFAYMAAAVVLGLLGMLRAVNYWDVNTLVGMGLLAVIVYSVWCVLVAPAVQWAGGRLSPTTTQSSKRKLDDALTIGDDGELVRLDDEEDVGTEPPDESAAYGEEAAPQRIWRA